MPGNDGRKKLVSFPFSVGNDSLEAREYGSASPREVDVRLVVALRQRYGTQNVVACDLKPLEASPGLWPNRHRSPSCGLLWSKQYYHYVVKF